MAFTTHKKGIVIWLLVCLTILCCVFLMGAKASAVANRLALRNATDSLILLVELATEAGPDYNEAKALFAELLRTYSNQMERRDSYWLLQLPSFTKKNIAKDLKRVEAEYLRGNDQQNEEAHKKIEAAKNAIAKFLTESKLFTDEQIVTFEPEVIPEDIKNDIRDSLDEAHKKAEIYANNEPRTVDDAKAVCMANRKTIVYLYLVRFGYQKIVSQEKLRTFRTDINRTIHYNRILQQTDALKGSKGEDHSDYWRLERYCDSERRRLRLLQAIIDNDMQQAQVLLQIALIESIPDIQFLAEKG